MNYKEKKTKGLITLKKVNDAYELKIKQFNINDGDASEPIIESISKESVRSIISDLENELEGYYELLKDMEV